MKLKFDEKTRIKINNIGFKSYQDYFGKNKKRNCMINGCNNTAIKSHAISKNASLRLISENSEVITIKSQRNKMEWEMKFAPESINDASTFGGFCNDHDRYFKRLDDGLMETWFDVISQCYRSMAHTLYNYEYYFQIYKNEMNIIDDIVELSNPVYSRLGITKEQYKIEYIRRNERLWSKRLDEYRRVETFKNELFDLLEINQSLKEKELGEQDNLEYGYINSVISYKRIPFLIPAALINRVSFSVKGVQSDLHYTLVPCDNCTHLIQFNYNNTDFFTNDFLSNTMSNISTLNYIERIMMYNEKDWYVSPGVINSIPPERRTIIETDMYFITERKFSDYYDVSIFDNIRQEIVGELGVNERNKELRKINMLPYRKALVDRKKESETKLNNIWLCK